MTQAELDIVADPRIVPARKLPGRVTALGIADGEGFRTREIATLDLGLDGIPGDRHAGFTRLSGGREPWYRRDTLMRSGRQLSIVSEEEMEQVRRAMDLPRLEAGWIGANIVTAGLPRLSFLPIGTRLFIDGEAVLVVEGQNAPCRYAGRSIAEAYPERSGLDLLFPQVAKRLRGVIATVERAGAITTGAAFTAKLPEQWIYA